MKTFITLLALFTAPAFAGEFDFPSDYPTRSQWAVGMVNQACHLHLSSRSHHGSIARGRGVVVYRVYNRQGRLVAAAKASSTSIFAKKICTLK